MKEKPDIKRLNRRQVLALRGLRVPAVALGSLRQAGILCDPAVSILWQKVPDTYVIRARESGGAVAAIGAYCGFVGELGERMSWAERIENIGRNGLHALVMAPKVVRVQAYRYHQTYDLLITRHRLVLQPGRKRPRLENAILFHGVRGRFTNPGRPAENVSDAPLPVFDDWSGNPFFVPQKFAEAARRALEGTLCLGCHHSHLLHQQDNHNQLSRGI